MTTTEGAAAEIRRSAALLRDAQSVRRRLEKLAANATEAPPSSKRLLDEALVAVQRLTDDLSRHQRVEKQRLQNALRSGRRLGWRRPQPVAIVRVAEVTDIGLREHCQNRCASQSRVPSVRTYARLRAALGLEAPPASPCGSARTW